MASPMLQEIFGGSLIGQAGVSFTQLNAAQRGMIAAIAASFTGLLSLFNIGGRLFWAALSDKIGRKTTYCIFFMLGIALYAAVPWTAHSGNKALFVGIFCIIVSMYGGAYSPTCSGRNSSAPFTTAPDGVVHRRHHRSRPCQLLARI
jgi:MFS family permease